MSLRDEQIFLPIVVEILQANAPARGYSRKHSDSSLQAAVAERSVAIVVKDGIGLARQSCDDHVRLAVIIVVLKDHAHAGQGPSIQIQRRSRLQRHFGKCAVAIVVKQILLHAIVGNIDVGKSVAIVIGERHTQTVPFLGCNFRALAHILECAVSAIVVENVGGAWKFSGRTVGMKIAAAVFAVLRVPVHVARDEEIQLAVVIIVEKSGRDGPPATPDTRLGGNVSEGAISVVVIENVFAIAGDVEIGIAVVVVIADGHAHAVVSVAGICQTSLLGHVGETAVLVLPVKPVPIAGIVAVEIFGMRRIHAATVYQEYI